MAEDNAQTGGQAAAPSTQGTVDAGTTALTAPIQGEIPKDTPAAKPDEKKERAEALTLIAKAKRMEAAARADMAAARNERERLQAEREGAEWKALREDAERFRHGQRLMQENQSEFAKWAGLDIRKLNESVINEGKRSPEEIVASELDKFKRKLEEENEQKLKAQQERTQQQQTAQQIAYWKGQLREIAEKDPEKYREVIATETFDRVWHYIEDYYEKTRRVMVRKTGNPNAMGQALDIKEALEAQEKYLRERRSKLTQPKDGKSNKPAPQDAGGTSGLSDTLKEKLARADKRLQSGKAVGSTQHGSAEDGGQQTPNPQQRTARKPFNYNRHAAELRQALARQMDN